MEILFFEGKSWAKKRLQWIAGNVRQKKYAFRFDVVKCAPKKNSLFTENFYLILFF